MSEEPKDKSDDLLPCPFCGTDGGCHADDCKYWTGLDGHGRDLPCTCGLDDKQKTTAPTHAGEHSPLPWALATNPGGPGNQPLFPSVRDSSGLPHGEDIVVVTLGNEARCKANAVTHWRELPAPPNQSDEK